MPEKRKFENGKNAVKRRKFNITPGTQGILVSSNSPTKSHDACREVVNILRDVYADLTANDSGADEKPREGENGSEDIEAELKSLQKEKEMFWGVEIGKGVEFIRFDPDLVKMNPSDLLKVVYQRISEQVAGTKNWKLPLVRYAMRVTPVDCICAPHMKSVARAAKSVVAAYFPDAPLEFPSEVEEILTGKTSEKETKKEECDTTETATTEGTDSPVVESAKDKTQSKDPEESADQTFSHLPVVLSDSSAGSIVPTWTVSKGTTWSVSYQSKLNVTVRREPAYELFASLIGNARGKAESIYPVNLSDSSVKVIMEICPLFCGISVIDYFTSAKKLNLFCVCHPNWRGPPNQRGAYKEATKELPK